MPIRFIHLFQWQSFVLSEKENLEHDSTILKATNLEIQEVIVK